MQEITVKELRKSLRATMFDYWQHIGETLDKVEPKERLEFIIRIMPYAFSKNDDNDIFDLKL
ncbi:MAG TPA: hypothetical protein P5268_06315 [Candidatus Marinimicrobia bacterium]|nr:hypothetical protein [Candidatus Neomarinimicrobiota bacterium]HRS51822.1 hypothetical protein [Candidatus Neomarinimicrobiota bacterium]HRU92626.1 hypothetical protein [Candidatus Neomarinimicrobiota bacterium]